MTTLTASYVAHHHSHALGISAGVVAGQGRRVRDHVKRRRFRGGVGMAERGPAALPGACRPGDDPVARGGAGRSPGARTSRANGGTGNGTPEDIALGLAIVRDPVRYLPAMLRCIVYSSKRASLEDETALSEEDIETDVQESWPLLMQMFADGTP